MHNKLTRFIFANINLLNIMKRGKRIEKIEDFVKGGKYIPQWSDQWFKFSYIDKSNNPWFIYDADCGKENPPTFSGDEWYEAVEEELEDITLEVKFEEYCRDTSGKFDVNKETKNIVDSMMDMVKGDLSSELPDSFTYTREVTVEQMLTDFNDTLSKEQKVAYEDMLGGGFDHVMVDIETLGTEPGCVILSVAAVRFNLDTGVISDRFMKVVSIDSCIKLGLGIDGGTLTWWFNQSEEAREHLKGNSNTIKSVLHSLSQFFRSDDQVWGNSARFDLGILAEAYKKVDKKLPWDFWNERDVRTLVSFKPEVKSEVVFEGEPHDPIDDCIHQVNYCHLIWRLINK